MPGDKGCRHDAALEGARIDGRGLPGRGDARRQRLGFGQALRGEFELGAAAKAFGMDAFDMAVAGQQDLGHPAILAGGRQPPATKAGSAR